VHAIDGMHRPWPGRDLPLHAARDAVIQVQVTPAVALGHPDDLPAVVEIVPERPTRIAEACGGAPIVDERGTRLVDERAGGARGRVHLDDAIALMPALVVFEREGAAVLAPFQA